eukprot:TRINITY_DN10012_c0_g5_i1.p1 TRINITY_DN10012_c0_g5~~TRINITY_DN10012_c0_g5_i1.p1  ORF type:complete len:220 (-),score=51.05 TRINITY_DN10012_c0_g5_i1:109-768(-)
MLAVVAHGPHEHQVRLRVWQPDQTSTACPLCCTLFSWSLRKHHCRQCGRVVCGSCSQGRVSAQQLKMNQSADRMIRICDECDGLLSEQEQAERRRAEEEEVKVVTLSDQLVKAEQRNSELESTLSQMDARLQLMQARLDGGRRMQELRDDLRLSKARCLNRAVRAAQVSFLRIAIGEWARSCLREQHRLMDRAIVMCNGVCYDIRYGIDDAEPQLCWSP